MTADFGAVSNWLSTVPDVDGAPDKAPAGKQSRKRLLPSPSMSDDESSPSKRLCFDPDTTPTRPRDVADWSSTASSHSRRSRSTRGSPTKGLAFLRIKHIIGHRSFGENESPPAVLKAMVRLTKRDATGTGILSSLDMNAIRNNGGASPLFDDLLDAPHLVDASGSRQRLGKLPDIDTLINVWEEAQECELEGHSEPLWNCAVHFPLLCAALRLAHVNAPDVEKHVRIKAVNVTTAKVPRAYATSTAHAHHDKRVDFCVCIKPCNGSSANDALYRVAQQAAHLSINHTDYTLLINIPISLSIETKRTGQDWQAALEKIRIWMAGHWKRIRELTRDSAAGADELEFLPGIIIQSHDWMFVASTQGRVLDDTGNRETVIWSKIAIGSTDGIQGICQIITILQRLASWSAQAYWPWFQRTVLGEGNTIDVI